MKTELQKIRRAAGYRSAKAFAEHLGMSAGTYTNYEQGKNKLTLELAWQFADALGEALGRFVSLDELAGRDWPAATSPPALTADECEIVDCYRDTDPRGRENIIETARREKRAQEPPAAGVREVA